MCEWRRRGWIRPREQLPHSRGGLVWVQDTRRGTERKGRGVRRGEWRPENEESAFGMSHYVYVARWRTSDGTGRLDNRRAEEWRTECRNGSSIAGIVWWRGTMFPPAAGILCQYGCIGRGVDNRGLLLDG